MEETINIPQASDVSETSVSAAADSQDSVSASAGHTTDSPIARTAEDLTGGVRRIGTRDTQLEQEDRNEKSALETEEEHWREIIRFARTQEILYSRLIGVETDEDRKKVNLITSIYGIRVVIPESQYFMPGFDFGASYAAMPESDRLKRRITMARYQMGARICFVIAGGLRGIQRTRLREEDVLPGQSPYEYAVIGSRVQAMQLLQDIWFFHKNRKPDSGAEPRTVQPGDAAVANVLSVREDGVRVECLGVESFISAFELSGLRYVTNCQNEVKPGDTIRVRIKSLHVSHDPDSVYMSVSGRLYDSGYAGHALKKMRVSGWYIGVVRSYNGNSGFYTINLNNGASAAVRRDWVHGSMPLHPGDTVSVQVIRILNGHVLGRAIRM